METLFIVGGIIIVVIFVVITYGMIKAGTRIIPKEERLVIHRLGRFHRVAGPGPVWVIPGLEKVVRKLEVRNRPIEVTVAGLFAFGVPNELTLNLWCNFDPVKAAGGDSEKLAKFVEVREPERRQQVESKLREALVNQIADIQSHMPLPANATLVDKVAALAPGSPRYKALLDGVKRELERTLPPVGVLLNTKHSIVLTRRSISDEILEAINRRQGREVDREWLSDYADKLRERFPNISVAVLVQILASIEGVDMGRVQRLLLEQEAGNEAEVEFEFPETQYITKPKNYASKTAREGQTAYQKSSKGTFLNILSPYIAGPPIIDPNLFFGRRLELEKIMGLLDSNFVMLIGPRRIGKTSVLHQLAYHLPKIMDRPEQFVPVMISVEGTPEAEFFHMLMEEIVNSIQKTLPAEAIATLSFDLSQSTYSARAFSRDLQAVLKELNRLASRLVLLLDEMDTLNTYSLETQSQLRRIFQRFTNRNLSVVVAGVKLQQHWAGESSPFYNMFIPVRLRPFTESQARRLIVEPVEGAYSYTEEAITRIIAATSGLPNRIQQLCLEIIFHLMAATQERKEITARDVDEVLQTIRWLDEEQSEGVATHIIDRALNIAEEQSPYQTKDKETNNEESQ